jgi:hypothetical protein
LFRFWNKFEDCLRTETSWFLYCLFKMYVWYIQHKSNISQSNLVFRSKLQPTRTNCNFYVHLRLLGMLTICRKVAPKCQMPSTWLATEHRIWLAIEHVISCTCLSKVLWHYIYKFNLYTSKEQILTNYIVSFTTVYTNHIYMILLVVWINPLSASALPLASKIVWR